ncbi:hypothetical protein PR048_015664 [Dryococelus australis]|uniref:HNH nuclease domain-containing protein n=1 Tax=Dryococelus australis TaxID=614101 RepID=A0ABQ9HHU9_9NEOP|nr:hypothetical protein PR048_015664 [Dryococelus australis]
MEQRRNEKAGKTGDLRKKMPTHGIVRHDSNLGKSEYFPDRNKVEASKYWLVVQSKRRVRRTWPSLCFGEPVIQGGVQHDHIIIQQRWTNENPNKITLHRPCNSRPSEKYNDDLSTDVLNSVREHFKRSQQQEDCCDLMRKIVVYEDEGFRKTSAPIAVKRIYDILYFLNLKWALVPHRHVTTLLDRANIIRLSGIPMQARRDVYSRLKATGDELASPRIESRPHPGVAEARYHHTLQKYAELGQDSDLIEDFATPMSSGYQLPSPPTIGFNQEALRLANRLKSCTPIGWRAQHRVRTRGPFERSLSLPPIFNYARHCCLPPTRTGFDSRRGRLPDIRMCESCQTMALVCGFSRVSPVSPAPFFPAKFHAHFTSPLSALRTLDVRSRTNLFTNSPERDTRMDRLANSGMDPRVQGHEPRERYGLHSRPPSASSLLRARREREIPEKTGIVRHDSHLLKSVDPAGDCVGSPWWEASVLITQPPWPRYRRNIDKVWSFRYQKCEREINISAWLVREKKTSSDRHYDIPLSLLSAMDVYVNQTIGYDAGPRAKREVQCVHKENGELTQCLPHVSSDDVCHICSRNVPLLSSPGWPNDKGPLQTPKPPRFDDCWPARVNSVTERLHVRGNERRETHEKNLLSRSTGTKRIENGSPVAARSTDSARLGGRRDCEPKTKGIEKGENPVFYDYYSHTAFPDFGLPIGGEEEPHPLTAKRPRINETGGQIQSPSLARPHILAPSTIEVLRSLHSETKRVVWPGFYPYPKCLSRAQPEQVAAHRSAFPHDWESLQTFSSIRR